MYYLHNFLTFVQSISEILCIFKQELSLSEASTSTDQIFLSLNFHGLGNYSCALFMCLVTLQLTQAV